MAQTKITDEQIQQHLQEGMTREEIAALYHMSTHRVSHRIRRMQQIEERQRQLREQPPIIIQPMDTVVRLSDRTWFRVKEIDEEKAVLCKTIAGEHPDRRRQITVSRDKLSIDFEKKDYAPVKCYIDPALKKAEKG